MADSRRSLKFILGGIAVLLLLGYGLFEARRYLQGPVLVIETPTWGQVMTGPAVIVTGYGKNLSYLYINGAQAYLDEEGLLTWVYTAPTGYTELEAEGRDRFGRSTKVQVTFIVK